MKPTTIFTKARSFKRFNEEAFNKDLECVPFNVAYIFYDIDDICWAWEKMYTNVLNAQAPIKSRRCRNTAGKSKFITSETKKAMWKRNTLKRKFNKTRSADDREAYRSQRNHVVSLRRKSIIRQFDQLCSSRAGNPREFWNSLRLLMHTRKRVPDDFIVLNEKERVIKVQSQVAEIFNEYFTNITKDLIVQKHTAFRDQAHINKIPMTSQRPVNTLELRLTNHHVVKVVLDNMKPNKAQGHDLIPPRAVKASSGSIAKPFSDLVNTIIAKLQVPGIWKHGQITPHHKKESVLDKKNFRPVTVLSAFAEGFEKIIHMQMTEHFESFFRDYMFANRKFHGFPLALLTLMEDWRAELDKRKVVIAVAIDLSKAFDCLPHELLLEKLKFYSVSDDSVALW